MFLDKNGYPEVQVENKLEELKEHLQCHFANALQLAADIYNFNSAGTATDFKGSLKIGLLKPGTP